MNNKLDTTEHEIYNNKNIPIFYNVVGGLHAQCGSIPYLDYDYLHANNENNIIALKLYEKDFNLKEYGLVSMHNMSSHNELINSEISNMILNMSKQKVRELGIKSFNEFFKNNEWKSDILARDYIKPVPPKLTFFQKIVKLFTDLFKPTNKVDTHEDNIQDWMRRRFTSKILALSNIVAIQGRRGPANKMIVNARLGTLIKDLSSFVTDSDYITTSDLVECYKIGNFMGIEVYIDPYLKWDDTTITLWRTGDITSPGLALVYKKEAIRESHENDMYKYHVNFKIVEMGERAHDSFITAHINIPDVMILK